VLVLIGSHFAYIWIEIPTRRWLRRHPQEQQGPMRVEAGIARGKGEMAR